MKNTMNNNIKYNRTFLGFPFSNDQKARELLDLKSKIDYVVKELGAMRVSPYAARHAEYLKKKAPKRHSPTMKFPFDAR